jgi:hypothetical protein
MNTVVEKMRSLYESHAAVYDGGYSLLEAILAYSNNLNGRDRRVVRDLLIQQVDQPKDWGVALEALTKGWGHDVAGELTRLLSSCNHTTQWQNEVVRSLLRVGDKDILKIAVPRIKAGLEVGDRDAVRLLAAVCHADSSVAVDMLATYLIALFERGRGEELQRDIGMFSANLLDCNPNLVTDVVRQCVSVDCSAGRHVATAFLTEIDTAFYRKWLGNEHVEATTKAIHAALRPPSSTNTASADPKI